MEEKKSITEILSEGIINFSSNLVQESERIIEEMGKMLIRQRTHDLAKQIEIFLNAHPGKSRKELQEDEAFIAAVLQPVGEKGYVVLCEQKTGTTVLYPDRSQWNDNARGSSMRSSKWKDMFEDAISGKEAEGYYKKELSDGDIESKFVYFCPIKGFNYFVGIVMYLEEFLNPIRKMDEYSKELAEDFSRRILKEIVMPLKKLMKATSFISSGNFEHRIEIKRSDEIGVLADSFNKMIGDLQNTTTSIDNLNREIAEREKLGRRLQKSNQELENFAYVVSHDLKAPLRGVRNLADWMSVDYAGKLDDQGKERMGLLINRVDRMQNLIDGILQYSRVGRAEEEKAAVNLDNLVARVIDMIDPPENITITVENQLPTVECSQTRVMQVFQNLLSNAVKYMDKPQGWIKIGCVEEDGFWKFSVADSGRGIEEQNFEKIFQLFQTVEPIDSSESTGVGLTLVKKIVEMYDGKLWVESKAGQGSTFFFTLSQQKVGIENMKLKAGVADSKA